MPLNVNYINNKKHQVIQFLQTDLIIKLFEIDCIDLTLLKPLQL